MGKLGKLFAWLFLLAIAGYVVFSILQGRGATGNVAKVPATGEPAQIIRYPDCIDTDDGKNYDRPGRAYNADEKVVYNDYCADASTLVEYFCNNKYPDRISVPCDCYDGACT